MDTTRSHSAGQFCLPPELSIQTWQGCVTKVLSALECSHGRLVVECSELQAIDDGGIAMLIGLSHYSQRRQIRVVLTNPPATLRQTLEVRGVAWLFEWRPLVG